MSELGTQALIVSGEAGADLSTSEYLAVVQNASNQYILAGAGVAVAGFVTAAGSTSLPTAAGGHVSVAVGGLVEAVAGAAIATAGEVEVDAAGKVIPLAAGKAVGWCFESAALDDVVVIKKY